MWEQEECGMCVCVCNGVGSVDREWVGGLEQSLEEWGGALSV